MKLTIEDIKSKHDKAYTANDVTRESAANDLVFYYVTHWDDALLEETQLTYKGEFDVLKKAGKDILAELSLNEIQVDFEPTDLEREDAGEVMDGLYRTDGLRNTSIESFMTGRRECVVCGAGAWELYTEYESMRSGDDRQVIRRRPIYEANNTVFWDPNSKLIDKSDAKYCSLIDTYTEDGYKDLVEELTGERPEHVDTSSFGTPNKSFAFPWVGGSGTERYIHVVSFFHVQKVKRKAYTLENPFGVVTTLLDTEYEKVSDELEDDGYDLVDEKDIYRNQVTKYICSGEKILSEDILPGEFIPVIQQYGEYAMVDGHIHYEGVTRLAKDPQRLRDFQLSFLADIASRSPREKPIFIREQVAGLEYMYDESGADNNYPYLLQNWKDVNGNQLPIGQVATLPAPNIPPALVASIQLSRQAIEDVANPGIPQDVADTDLSGKAVRALQAKIDKQSLVYQENMKYALRRDGEVYASMASEIYDVPRQVKLTLPDGTKKTVQMMEQIIDQETGELVTLRDIFNVEFEVFTKIGPSYSSQKEETIDRLESLIQTLLPQDPKREILLLKLLKLMDGIDFDDVREYANKQLVVMGIKKPETPEEEQALMQAQQAGQQPSAEMVLAMAEQLKGQAANKEADIKLMQAQAKAATDNAKIQVDTFNAQTKRYEAQIDAQETGAKISKTEADRFGKQIENQAKLIELKKPENLTDDELLEAVMGA